MNAVDTELMNKNTGLLNKVILIISHCHKQHSNLSFMHKLKILKNFFKLFEKSTSQRRVNVD